MILITGGAGYIGSHVNKRKLFSKRCASHHKYRSPDFEEIHKLMKHPIIFDGRNQYDPAITGKYGFELHQIGM